MLQLSQAWPSFSSHWHAVPCCRSQGMGLLLGALVTNPKSAQALASVVTLTMVLTGVTILRM